MSNSIDRPTAPYRGRAVYIYAYDIANEITGEPGGTLLGQPIEQFAPGPTRRTPREAFFYHSRMVRLPAVRRVGPDGPVDVTRTIKIFPIGAISIAVHVEFAVKEPADLVDYHDVQLDGVPLQDEVRALAEQVRAALADHLDRPVAQIRDEEAYTVFCLESPLRDTDGTAVDAEDWLAVHRRDVAAVLTQEPDPGNLSDQEADESTGQYLSYYQQDLTVIDWDAALVVDGPANFDDTLHIIELANVELCELETYDHLLDDVLVRAYRDLRRPTRRRGRAVLADLKVIRLDLARLSDELSNITKFFGDWHLARLYQQLAARFHLADWKRTVDQKLDTLDDLYQIVKQDQMNRWMMILEVTIVLLFIIDLVILVMVGG